MYNYNHLYYFYISVKLQGITKAAKYLNTSQPSLSAQIKALEHQLKKKLFVKSGRTLVLTDEGQHVFNYCKKMFEISDELEEYLKGESPLQGRGVVRIGVSQQIDRPFVAEIINSALRLSDTTSTPLISLVSENDNHLLSDLKIQKIDVFIGNHAVYDDEFEVVSTLNMPVALVAAPQLAEALNITPRSTFADVLKKGGKRLLLPSRELKLRQEIDLYLQRKKLLNNLGLLFESDAMSTICRSVSDEMGLAFVPLPYIKRELKQNKIKTYPFTKVGLWHHKLTLMVRRNRRKIFFVEQMIHAIKSL